MQLGHCRHRIWTRFRKNMQRIFRKPSAYSKRFEKLWWKMKRLLFEAVRSYPFNSNKISIFYGIYFALVRLSHNSRMRELVENWFKFDLDFNCKSCVEAVFCNLHFPRTQPPCNAIPLTVQGLTQGKRRITRAATTCRGTKHIREYIFNLSGNSLFDIFMCCF